MPTYRYQAADSNGNLLEGTMEARDERIVSSRLQDLSYFPISIQLDRQPSGLSREFSLRNYLGRVRRRDVLALTQQLATLLNAGLPLDRSLQILVELTDRPAMRQVLESLQRSVEGGAALADALARHPRLFSRLYVNMVRSGESGGVLDKVLLRLVGFLEASQELREQLISALIYPCLLFAVGSAAVAVLVTVVIPRFSEIFSDMGKALPVPTQILLDIANFVQGFWWLFVILAILAWVGYRTYVSTDAGRLKVDGLKLRAPVLGALIRKLEVARFARTLGTLGNSGVPLLDSLAIVRDTLVNTVLAQALDKVYGGIREGGGLARPLSESGVFPGLALHMIQVGEQTGELENMLLKIADTYELEVQRAVRRLTSLLEPLMILVMGVIVGSIVMAMLMAITALTDIPL